MKAASHYIFNAIAQSPEMHPNGVVEASPHDGLVQKKMNIRPHDAFMRQSTYQLLLLVMASKQ